ncbi:WD40-repeat-containing domain protein [Circinella umbellata]|nr:WD40-repeat-containing domain protein [Circinella umbellata]
MLPPTSATTSTKILAMMPSSTTATTATSTNNPSSKPLLVNTNAERSTTTDASTSSNNNTCNPSPPLSTPSSTPTTVRILVETSLSSPNNSTSHLDRSTIVHDHHHNSTGYPLSNAVTPPSLRPCRIFNTKPQQSDYLANKRRGSSSTNNNPSSSSNTIYNKKRARLETFLPPLHYSTINTASSSSSSSAEASRSEAYIDKYAMPSPSYPINLNDEEEAITMSTTSGPSTSIGSSGRVSSSSSFSLEDTDIEFDPNMTETLRRLPNMVHTYDTLSSEMKSYVLFQLLKRSSTNTLQFVNSMIVPALKRDFLASLPLELALHVISYLDAESLCRAACVSHKWRSIIDSDISTWKRLLEKDNVEYKDPWQDEDDIILDDEDEDIYDLDYEENDDGIQELEEKEARGDVMAIGIDLNESMFEQQSDMDIAEDVEEGDRELSEPHVKWRQAWYGADLTSLPMKALSTFSQQHKSHRNSNSMTSNNHNSNSISNHSTTSSNSSHSSGSKMDIDGINDSNNTNNYNRKGKLKAPNHPYKDIYRRHYTLRQNWNHGRAKRINFEGHPGHVVTCLEIVDNDKIISGADDNFINIYDIATGQQYHSLQGHEGGVWALQYYRNTLVSGSTDRTVRVWDIRQGVCTHVFLGHTSTVRCLQIIIPTLVNGKMEPSVPLIVTGSRDATLRVWRLPNLDRDETFNGVGVNPWFMHTLTGHNQSVRALAAHGNRLVSGSYDCSVCVWNVEQGSLLHRMEGHTQKVYAVVIDPERQRCMSGSMDSTVRIWDMEHGHCLKVLEGHSILVGLLGLTPNYLVSAAADASLRIWSPENGGCQHVLSGHRGAITCFHHDETKVISGSEGGLKMWDIKTGRHVRDLITGVNGVWRVAFDRRRCVAAVHRNNITSFEVLDFGVYGLEDESHLV